ncbi:MAG TPA: hypothetical protein VF623_03970, partial [Segetibacter sp.]
MKRTFAAFAFVAVFAACNSKPETSKDTATPTVTTDTAAGNQALMNDNTQSVNMNGVSDTIIASDGSQYVKVQPGQAAALAPVASAPAARKSTATSGRKK